MDRLKPEIWVSSGSVQKCFIDFVVYERRERERERERERRVRDR